MKIILMNILLLISFITYSSAQVYWTKDPQNPVLSGGDEGEWNRHVFSPSVLYNEDSSRFEMWFGASSAQTEDWRPYRIGFATSPNGIVWEMHPDPVLEPTPGTLDAYTTEQFSVLREDGQYKMWYTGSADFVSFGVFHATSSDGIHWTKDTVNYPVIENGNEEWENHAISHSFVMPFESGYKIWYTGHEWFFSKKGVGYATSEDGVNWQVDTLNNPVLTAGRPGSWDDFGAGWANILKFDNLYCMWFSGMRDYYPRQIGLATSFDGINWTKYNDPLTNNSLFRDSDPVIKPSPGQWDGNNVEDSPVLLINDTLHVWYAGSAGRWHIGHATSQVYPDADFEYILSDSLQIQFVDRSLGVITGWHWDFGDGDTSSIQNPAHTYQQEGIYTVMLTINGPFGIDSTSQTQVIITGLKEKTGRVNREFTLYQNYPNPFNPETTIEFTIPKTEFVTLKIYNLLGQKIKTLVSQRLSSGSYSYEWDASNQSSGIYMYSLETGDFREVKKMIFLK